MIRVGVVASGDGTNLQAVIDAMRTQVLDATIAVVISNNSGAGALERARASGIPTAHLSGVTHPDPDALDAAILDVLRANGADVVLLAGYNKLLGPRTLFAYANRVLNTHPAPLPRFGGTGMFGMAVHEAVLASGVAFSGPTVHLCDAEYDHGPVVAHAPVPVQDGDTPETLRDRVMARERVLVVETLHAIAAGMIDLDAAAHASGGSGQ